MCFEIRRAGTAVLYFTDIMIFLANIMFIVYGANIIVDHTMVCNLVYTNAIANMCLLKREQMRLNIGKNPSGIRISSISYDGNFGIHNPKISRQQF